MYINNWTQSTDAFLPGKNLYCKTNIMAHRDDGWDERWSNAGIGQSVCVCAYDSRYYRIVIIQGFSFLFSVVGCTHIHEGVYSKLRQYRERKKAHYIIAWSSMTHSKSHYTWINHFIAVNTLEIECFLVQNSYNVSNNFDWESFEVCVREMLLLLLRRSRALQ